MHSTPSRAGASCWPALPDDGVSGGGRQCGNTAVEQLAFAKSWFATYKTVAVRKAIEDELQAVLSGKKQPKEAITAAQKAADEILRPYVEQTALKLPMN